MTGSHSDAAPGTVSAGALARRTGKFVAKFAVSAGTLYLVARAADPEELAACIRRADPRWLALAAVIFLAAQVVSSLRCAYVVRALGSRLSLARSIEVHFIGLWFNQVFPTSLGGDVVKIARLRHDLGLSLAVRATLLDRVSGLVFLLLSVVVLLPWYRPLLNDDRITAALGAGAALSLATMGLLARYGSRQPALAAAIPGMAHLAGLFGDMYRFRRGQPLRDQLWTSGVVHFNGIIAYALIGQAIGVYLPFQTYLLLTPLVFLVALLPISLAGWGIREAGAVWIFGLAGTSAANALAMSVLFGLMLIFVGAPGLAFMLLAKERRQG